MTQKLVILLLICLGIVRTEKVQITAYIESLCPDTTRFIQNSLLKALQTPEFDNLVELRLVSYGKATQSINENEDLIFKCQHGEVECFGNRVQACGFEFLQNSQQERIEFLTCIQKSRKRSQEQFESEIKECLPDLWEGVLECAKGTEGFKLLWKNGEETLGLNPRLTYVPWITINGEYNAKAHQIVERNIVQWACQNAKINNLESIEACDEYV